MIIYCYFKCYQNAVSVCLKEHKTHRFMNLKIYIRTTLQTVYTKTYSACVSWSMPIHHYSTYIIRCVSSSLSTSCSSVKLWKGTVIAGYGTGQIRLYEAVTGILHAEVNAHARWIYTLDIAPFTGLVRKDVYSTVCVSYNSCMDQYICALWV